MLFSIHDAYFYIVFIGVCVCVSFQTKRVASYFVTGDDNDSLILFFALQ